ncbi:MAG: TonB-dependent receptor [Hyphomonadaceae bacterium]
MQALISARRTALAVAMLFLGAGAARGDDAGAVIVTGSLLRNGGDAPVSVLSSEDLAQRASLVETLKALNLSAGAFGDANQFTVGVGKGQFGEGTGMVNLRGLGPQRTLVLLNGKRTPAQSGAADTNMLPAAAIDRIEVLKEGGAATYGSDALGGVVNFITKGGFEGLEAGGDYRLVDGSGGDWKAFANYGWVGAGGMSALISAGYSHRSELKIIDRDWAHVPYTANPEGGWSGASSPTQFIPLGGFTPLGGGVARTDAGCAALGGVLTNPNTAAPSGFGNCRTQYTLWANLVEREDRYQIYTQGDAPLGWANLHLETAYSFTDVPKENTSPSFATTRGITRTVLPAGIPDGGAFGFNTVPDPDTLSYFYVPGANPGFAAYVAANPTAFPAGTDGAYITLGTWRPFMAGGNPLFGNGASYGFRQHEQTRFSVALDGALGDWGALRGVRWNTSLTYGAYRTYQTNFDSLTGRVQLALRGLGGPNCNPATGAPGVGGCLWLNPFSNAVAAAPRNGLINPGFNPAVANSAELVAWMYPFQWQKFRTDLWEWDAQLDGETAFALAGGPIAWALGAQARRNGFKSSYSTFADANASPCADTPITGALSCFPAPTSPNVFLGTARALDLDQTVWAAFGEARLPLTTALNLSLAARYEDYGNDGGSSFDPQARVQWRVSERVSLRGSIGTTFRAPPMDSLVANPTTTLQNAFGTFVPIEVRGNPDLKPETAMTWSAGARYDGPRLAASVDYWAYAVKDVLTAEPLNTVLTAGFGGTSGVLACGSDAGFIAAHFEFSAGCASNAITKIKLLQINGPDIDAAGVDISASYAAPDVAGGALRLGADATYYDRYDVGALRIGAATVPASAFDGAGKANIGTLAYPIPRWKAQAYAEFAHGAHTLRWGVRYASAYDDQRAIFGPGGNAAYQTRTAADCATAGAGAAGCGVVAAGRKISAQVLNDLTWRWALPHDALLSLGVFNVFDEDPPFARTEINYDALTGDPIGRTVQVGLRKKF